MAILRILGAALPQILLLLFVGAGLDLLGGWNHTSGSTEVLVMLFLLNPVVTAALLVAETVGYWRKLKRRDETRSFLMPGLALCLFIEALGIDAYLVTQIRM